jgi:hypothetical protein
MARKQESHNLLEHSEVALPCAENRYPSFGAML